MPRGEVSTLELNCLAECSLPTQGLLPVVAPESLDRHRSVDKRRAKQELHRPKPGRMHGALRVLFKEFIQQESQGLL